MSTVESAKNQDPTLYCAYFGGPRDGFKTGDLPAPMSGKNLTGMISKLPLSEPYFYSLYAVYKCTSETQIDGFWEFHFIGMEGPEGEQLVATHKPDVEVRRAHDAEKALSDE
ncbi:hypothetical protein [uncultured Microbacterium sp.]|uniref:hypothetical protein n=1 Tax=uncultured Microbacterium sp. TaxID=191216 RepID=UPI0026351326|nr:hypothetical protein [uncultured Microbacterium sp.]